eukprot:scaffold393_cov104-Isochrysis_galbana.AAC.6
MDMHCPDCAPLRCDISYAMRNVSIFTIIPPTSTICTPSAAVSCVERCHPSVGTRYVRKPHRTGVVLTQHTYKRIKNIGTGTRIMRAQRSPPALPLTFACALSSATARMRYRQRRTAATGIVALSS